MTSENAPMDFTLPIARVTCYSPSGLPTTAVQCFNIGAILYAVEHANPADSVHLAGVHAPKRAVLSCQWTKDCQSPVTHLDRKGYIYCSHHAQASGRGRKLTASELRRMTAAKA